jgi:hypothetical protein
MLGSRRLMRARAVARGGRDLVFKFYGGGRTRCHQAREASFDTCISFCNEMFTSSLYRPLDR